MRTKTSEIYDEELKKMVTRAKSLPFSAYAEFMFANKGYYFIDMWGTRFDKWEVFGSRSDRFRRVKK